MNDKLNFKDWYKEKYDPTGYLYPSAPLSIGFQDYCARVNEYLEYLANGVDTRTEPALPIQSVGGSLLQSLHQDLKGFQDMGFLTPDAKIGLGIAIEQVERYMRGELDARQQ
jgi:hypothetical protein